MPERRSLWSPTFTLACVATLAFFTSLTMQAPVVPGFLRSRTGASDTLVGVFIMLFTVVGVGLRPWVGRSLARRSRRGFMIVGALVTAAASLGYLSSRSLAVLIPVRLFHGVALACYYTAASTLVADGAPAERRGEALSYFSMFLYVGLAGGGALGLALADGPGYEAAFGSSAAIALGCAAVAFAIDEPAVHTPESIEAERHPLISRPALFPGAVLALAAVGYSSVLNFTADFADREAIGGRRLYFPVLAASVIFVRLFSGILADRYGRIVVAVPGLSLFCAAIAMQSAARSTGALLAAAAVGGIGFGMFFPSMMAFTVDRVPPVQRGSALGTFTGAFDLGFGVGSLLLGTLLDATDHRAMYLGAAAAVAAGIGVLVAGPAAGRARSRAATSSDGAASASS